MSKHFDIDISKEKLFEEQKSTLAPPPRYKVILNNDDYTPMDFVVDVLMHFFNMDTERANQIMMAVHYEGKAVCGIYTSDIAETKVAQVNNYAKENGHPLLCSMEHA